ncbi:MAG: methylated-DNA--[protein]-cysteine S-methyltransferase [Bacillota bacterium]
MRTPWGFVGMAASSRGLEEITLPLLSPDEVRRELGSLAAGGVEGHPGSPAAGGASAFLDRAVAWLEEYCRDARGTSPVPVEDLAWERVSAFAGRVLRLLLEIRAGETLTYGQVAARVGSPRGARAVGRACAANPWPLLVPCHRVVGSRGLGGYGGGLDLKEALLTWERRNR